MKNKQSFLEKTICISLLVSTFLVGLIPVKYVYAEDEPLLGEAAHGAIQEKDYSGKQTRLTAEQIKKIYNNTPLTNEPYAQKIGDEMLVVFGSQAKTADSDVDTRYATMSYQIEYKGQKVSIAAQNLIGEKANGGVTKQYMGFSSTDIGQALLNQGFVNSLDEGKELAKEMFTSGEEVKIHAGFAVTHNGTKGLKKTYADGLITLNSDGEPLYKGKPIYKWMLEGDKKTIDEINDLLAYDEDAVAMANKYHFNVDEIRRNRLRKLKNGGTVKKVEAAPPKEEIIKEVELPQKLMVTYNTWDNKDKARSSSGAYYVTYNDSRNYDDSIGHHDAFTAEDGNGLVIPSSESFVNGAENDAYFGSVAFSLQPESKTYAASYKYSYDLVEWNPHMYSSTTSKYVDGVLVTDTTYEGGWEQISTSTRYVSVSTSRKAYTYQLDLENTDLNEFSKSVAYNDAFGSDTLNYNNKDPHIINSTIGPDNNGPVMGGVSTTTQTPSFITAQGHIDWQNVSPSDDEKQHYVGHLDGPYDGGFTEAPENIARILATENLEWHVGDGKTNKSHKTDGSEVESYASVTTDKFEITYGGNTKTFLDGASAWVRFEDSPYNKDSNFTANEAAAIPYLTKHFPKNMFLPNNGGGIDVNTFETTPAFGKTLTKVPDNQSNGEYPTSVDATYTVAVSTSGMTLGKGTKTFSKAGNIKDSYRMNEPVKVHTPVISPVEIYRDNGQNLDSSDPRISSSETDPVYSGGEVNGKIQTQLVKGKANDKISQLRLDETYWFKFSTRAHLEHMGYRDANTHSNAWDNLGDTDSKYDKYVKAKYVHFPTDTILYQSGSPRYIKHEADENSDGYWVKLDRADWEYVKFYIPVWAKEGVHGSGEDMIRYKVESINVVSSDSSGQGAGDHTKEQKAREKELNDHGNGDTHPDKELYVATYEIPIQISGWLYDLQVVGINDSRTFNSSYDEDNAVNSMWYSLAANGEEKKAGIYNRLGGDGRYTDIASFVRRSIDGKLFNPWSSKNILAIGAGSSNRYDRMGEQRLGSQFAFSVRTISNLWHDNDSIDIVPTYRYYDVKKGKTYSQDGKDGQKIYIYYHDLSGSVKQLYVPYGSADDKKIVSKVQLGRKEFLGSYYDRDLVQTVKFPKPEYNASGDVIGFNNSKAGNFDDETTFLQKWVDSYTLSSIKLPAGLRLFSGDEEQLRDNLDKAPGSTSSIEDLYGTGADTKRLNEILENSMQTWYGEYYVPADVFVSTMSPDELYRYAENNPGGLSSDDEKVWLKDGYLILNFDVVSVKEGQRDLQFAGDNDGFDMGKAQGQKEAVKVPDPYDPFKLIELPTKSGDIMAIRTDKSVRDETQAEIFMIN